MPTIATMFNSRLPPHSIIGYTTKTVQGSYCFFGFPTNGQAKELPMPHGYASGGTSRELNQLFANTRPGYLLLGNYYMNMPPPVLWDLYPRILDYKTTITQ